MDTLTSQLLSSPKYCQYSKGSCDQSFQNVNKVKALFLYPTEPNHISDPIEEAIEELRKKFKSYNWVTWKDFQTGNIIFCSVCKAIRAADLVVIDVTTLNFNVMFELGYAHGLNKSVIYLKDTSYKRDQELFKQMGIIDTIKYESFTDSNSIVNIIESYLNNPEFEPIPTPEVVVNKSEPLYVIKPERPFEQSSKLLRILDASAVSNYRQFDEYDTTAQSIYDIQKNILASVGVVAAIPSHFRNGYEVHNARVAFMAGMSLAYEKQVLILKEHEENFVLPIDYRHIIGSCRDLTYVERFLKPFLDGVIKEALSSYSRKRGDKISIIQQIDFGQGAAESELHYLSQYFYKTAQYFKAKEGESRLIVGRKGTGKTAIFYTIRNSYGSSKNDCLVDLKPDGYQFEKIKDCILKLDDGIKLHALTAFWYYSFLCEVCFKLRETEELLAIQNPQLSVDYDSLFNEFSKLPFPESETFAERLTSSINDLSKSIGEFSSDKLTQHLFKFKKESLYLSIKSYLKKHKNSTWLLIDNLDRNWPIQGSTKEDIGIVSAMVDALSKIRNDFREDGLNFNCLVFLRNDIFRNLIGQTTDKDKDDAILLDWNDTELFKKLIELRLNHRSGLPGNFDELWPTIFCDSVGTKSSFNYIVERTLMRPRDLIQFLTKIIEVTINRGKTHVSEDDILTAEKNYSYYMIESLKAELATVIPDVENTLYQFYTCPEEMLLEDIEQKLPQEKKNAIKIIDILMWYGFLGVIDSDGETVHYSFNENYNTKKLWHYVENLGAYFVIHPAYRVELGCS